MKLPLGQRTIAREQIKSGLGEWGAPHHRPRGGEDWR